MNINDLDFFHKATKHLCGSLDPAEMLKAIYYYLRDFMPIDFLHLSKYDPHKKMLYELSSYYSNQKSIFPLSLKVSREVAEVLENDWVNKVTILVNETEKDIVGKFIFPLKGGSYSAMGLRLNISNENLGIVCIGSLNPNLYTKEHLRLLELLHDPFGIAVANILKYKEILELKDMLVDDRDYLVRELNREYGDEVIGEERGLKSVMDMVTAIAPLDTNILLLGETGTGKEVIANAIHHSSSRNKGPFIKVNCGALPDNLVDAELFGHEKGAFTGAVNSKRGRFERADGGTIFLDEIGELPPQIQTRLLRVIQEKTIERVGGDKSIKVNIRIIAATHRDLQKMVKEGTFREDLWYRLNVFPITIPPLRQRKEDIPDLINYFISKKSSEMGFRKLPEINDEQLAQLIKQDWPGNVRELENAVEKTLILSLTNPPDDELTFENRYLPKNQSTSQLDSLNSEKILPLDEMLKKYIEMAIEKCNGRIEGEKGAATLLNLHPSTLRNKMNKLGILYGKKRHKY